jgi:hypothetical protein
MNSEDLTLPLNETEPDAPSTQPLLKELLTDVREVKISLAALAGLPETVQRIEQRLDGIEREQKLARFGMAELSDRQLRQGERLTMLERDFDATQKVAA